MHVALLCPCFTLYPCDQQYPTGSICKSNLCRLVDLVFGVDAPGNPFSIVGADATVDPVSAATVCRARANLSVSLPMFSVSLAFASTSCAIVCLSVVAANTKCCSDSTKSESSCSVSCCT